MNMKISEKITNITNFIDGSQHYLSVDELFLLFDNLNNLENDVKAIIITPFYFHHDFMIEFEIRKMAIHFANFIDSHSKEEYYKDCMVPDEHYLNDEIEKRYHLVKYNDREFLNVVLKELKEYIIGLSNFFIKEIKEDYKLDFNEIFLGNLCFEVYTY